MGTGAGGNVDELEELAERINKAARTSATNVSEGDMLPDWLQPFDENLASNEGNEQKKGEQEAAAPFAPASAAAQYRMTMTSSWSTKKLVVKEHDPDEQHADRKITKVHDPELPTEEEVRQHLLCHLPYRSWCHHCISRGRGVVQSVEQVVRTLKSALDERMAVKIDTFHSVLTWLCEYAGLLLNRLEVSSDGKTSYEGEGQAGAGHRGGVRREGTLEVPRSGFASENGEDQRQVVLWPLPWSEVDERKVDRGGPGDQEHQIQPHGAAACSCQGTVVVRQFAVGCNRPVEQRER